MGRRAPRFHDFIGQKKVVDILGRQLAGAMARGEPFPHTLLHGPSGVGKTLLARMLAREYGTNLVEAMGTDDLATLTPKLSMLQENDFVMIDEGHRLRRSEQELLYMAIDHRSIPVVEGKGTPGERADETISLPPWCLVIATDQPGLLRDALHKRIELQVPLDFYREAELKEVVEVLAKGAGLLLSPQACRLIAKVSSGLPRKALQHLRAIRRHHRNAGDRQLGKADAEDYLNFMGYDPSGLGPIEFRYLRALEDRGNASLETLALAIGGDTSYLRRQAEPVLVRRNLVAITSGGRQLTPSGKSLAEEHRKTHPEPIHEKEDDDDDD